MTPSEQHETYAAKYVVAVATSQAQAYHRFQDVNAATVAILMLALEMATPNLTPQLRASLFESEE